MHKPLYSLTVFGHTFGARPADPTPLEVAMALYVRTQMELLTAHTEAERASANVAMYTTRLARLKHDIQILMTEEKKHGE